MQALKRRRFDLERKELEMKESLKKFDKFLQAIQIIMIISNNLIVDICVI